MRRTPESNEGRNFTVDRRTLLIGGGATAGLLLAWGLWPRSYRPNLAVGENETLINAFLKIDTAGQVIVVVPQLEMGQGVTTILPQILADELGADWRTVGVQGAPVSPLYANQLLAEEFLSGDWSRLARGAGDWALREIATRRAMMLTGGSTSLRNFGAAYRDAGAAARVLLCKAAAARWDIAWESCRIEKGLVTDGQRTLHIGELAGEAAGFALPDIIPPRPESDERLLGENVARLDLPSKIDGSHNFAADIRVPDMVYASIRQGPVGAVRLKSSRDAEAKKVPGFLQLVKQDQWIAAVATNWWAANKALDALDPLFELDRAPLESAAIDMALTDALDGDVTHRFVERGDIDAAFQGAHVLRGDYAVAPALHLAIEPPCATARVGDALAEIWTASQAPAFCRRAVAKALGMSESSVVLYPISAGGSFGRRLDHEPAVQAALIAREVKRPVQLLYSRAEDIVGDRPRAPARARMWAKLAPGGHIDALHARVAAPAADAQTWRRVAHLASPTQAMDDTGDAADLRALSGLPPLYAIPNLAIEHCPATVPVPAGRWRGNADSYNCFFIESFVDELAYKAGIEPLSFRIQHLADQPRLARCLTTATAMGGWQGGIMGSGQGIAVHAMDDGYIAVLVEATMEGGTVRAKNIVAVADVGNQPHPDIARQQIEGGVVFGLAAALGVAGEYRRGLPRRVIMGRLGLPRLADVGSVSVELLPSEREPAGVGQIGVPAVAPALAGALYTLTGRRNHSLPLVAPR